MKGRDLNEDDYKLNEDINVYEEEYDIEDVEDNENNKEKE